MDGMAQKPSDPCRQSPQGDGEGEHMAEFTGTTIATVVGRVVDGDTLVVPDATVERKQEGSCPRLARCWIG